MQQFLAEQDSLRRGYLRQWNFSNPVSATTLFQIVGDVHERHDDYRVALDAIDAIRKYDVTPVNDSSFYVYLKETTREHSHRFRDLFVNTDGLVVSPIEYGTEGEMIVEVVGDADDLQAIVSGLPNHLSVSVNRLSEYDACQENSVAFLTDRQREVLLVAQDLGYYEIPRQASVRDVADELACSKSTVTNHLRKAEARIVAQYGGATRQADSDVSE
ncbi:helix-turn-helix domain-containing protein (plasmid) [Haloferax sp. S1W]|uniref:helix-turn-helix domain-containing protein n=1 Tax=Haloferax sp. S1W TaxID=3377110 RepID=UPI0037CA0473